MRSPLPAGGVSAIADLGPPDRHRADPGLDHPLRTMAMPDEAGTAIGKTLLLASRPGTPRLPPRWPRPAAGERPRAARPSADRRSRRGVETDERWYRPSWRIAPSGGSGRLGHPPRYAALSIRHHPASAIAQRHQLALQKPKLTNPPPDPLPGLPMWVHRNLPRPPLRATPMALRCGRGSLLCTTRISPTHTPKGSRLNAKGGSRLEAI